MASLPRLAQGIPALRSAAHARARVGQVVKRYAHDSHAAVVPVRLLVH